MTDFNKNVVILEITQLCIQWMLGNIQKIYTLTSLQLIPSQAKIFKEY